ncbi:hypothetical protein [Streptomyces sp. CS159]|uniref:hypothetical protein n=1 Tax=Streptomyces sp. CS159 TaxID=1982762 RepID=UPI000B408096|nr:hypothetical protein [Streptomyces sp. CS159]
MRMPRFLARRPRPAALLAAGLATTLLGTAAVFSPVTADPQAGPALPTPLTTATAPASTAPAVSDDARAAAYNEGWMEGEDDLMATDCKTRIPTDVPQSGDPLVDAYNAGWHDGQVNLADSGACEPENLNIGPDDATLTADYNDGWEAGVKDLGDGTAPTSPDGATDGSDPRVIAFMDGWIDGQADALGDDNRDGIVDEDESGWDCHTMGNRQCGPQGDASPAQR